MSDLPPYPGAPRWVKILGIIVASLVLLVAVVTVSGIGGPHGPGRHLQSSADGSAPSDGPVQRSLQSP
jgi:hypothetical protein